MPEDVLRYRVEIDPRQAESALSTIRGGVGAALSDVRYGAGLVSGGFNSLRSDLAYGAGSVLGAVTQPPIDSNIRMDRAMQSLQVGAAEAAMGLGSLAPWALGAYGVGAATLGTATMNAGIVAGGSMLAGGAASAASAVASGIAGTAGMVAGGVGSALAAPAALPLALGAAAGATLAGGAYVAVQSAERAYGDMQARFDIQNRLTGAGMSLSEARGVSSRMVQAGREIGTFTGTETAALFDEFAAAGSFNRISHDPQRLERAMRDKVRATRQIMQALDVGSRAAVEMINELGGMGVGAGDAAGAVMSMRAGARVLGQAGMAQASQMGANLAASMGMRGVAGVNVGISAGIAAQTVGAGMDPAIYRMLGGQQGIQGAIMRGQMGFMQSPMGMAVGLGTVTDPRMMSAYMSGRMGMAGAMSASADAFARGGVKSMFAMDDAVAKMSGTELQAFQELTSVNAMSEIGIGMDAEHLALIMANMPGSEMDMTTPQGRQMALARARAVMDPASKMRQLSAMNREAYDRMEHATGLGARAKNAARATWDYTTGTAVPYVAKGATRTVMAIGTMGASEAAIADFNRRGGFAGLSEAVQEGSNWAAETSRKAIPMIEAAEGHLAYVPLGNVAAGAAKLGFRGLGALAGPQRIASVLGRDVGQIGRGLRAAGVRSGADLMTLMRNVGGLDVTDAEIAAQERLNRAIAPGARISDESYGKALRTMLGDQELVAGLEGLSDADKIAKITAAAGLGDADVDRASVAQAMRKMGMEFGPDPLRNRIAARASELRGEIRSTLGAADFTSILGEGFSPLTTTLGDNLNEILRANAGTPAQSQAAQAVAQYARAVQLQQDTTGALKTLEEVVGEDKAMSLAKSFGKDRGAAGKVRAFLQPVIKKGAAQAAMVAGALSPEMLKRLGGMDSDAAAKFLASIGGEDIAVGAESARDVNVFGTASERRAVEALNAIQGEAQAQIALMTALTDRLERLSNR